MYGFGGVPRYLDKPLRPDQSAVKCWNLAGEPEDDEPIGSEKQVKGTMGALKIYHTAAKNTTFAGPTYFAGILQRFMDAV